MLGVVGRIKINCCLDGKQYEEIVDPQITVDFVLDCCSLVRFKVEEITYVEDTIYCVVLTLIEPENEEVEFVVGSSSAEFFIEKYGIAGTISLCI